VPTPVRDSVVGEFDALLVNVRVALAVPVDCGVKVTVKPALWPAAIVTGSDKPLNTNSELLEFAELTVTLAPVALIDPADCPLEPTTTFPIFMVVGETPN